MFTPDILARINVEETIVLLASQHHVGELQLAKPKEFIAHAKRQIDPIERRVMKGEAITHSAVESSINALEVHGLDKGLDHGIDGFKRYVDLAVVSRNIQKIGQIKRDKERERLACERERLRQRQEARRLNFFNRFGLNDR